MTRPKTWRSLPAVLSRAHSDDAALSLARTLAAQLVREHKALLVEVEGLREVRAAYRDRLLAWGRQLGSLQAAELQRARDTLKRYGEPRP